MSRLTFTKVESQVSIINSHFDPPRLVFERGRGPSGYTLTDNHAGTELVGRLDEIYSELYSNFREQIAAGRNWNSPVKTQVEEKRRAKALIPLPKRVPLARFLEAVRGCDRLTFRGGTTPISSKTREGWYFTVQRGLSPANYFIGKALDEPGQPIVVEDVT